tara:strand:+ start:450 stop:845 length:396 start_codon:yes stop_codon:yes gene_type:complete
MRRGRPIRISSKEAKDYEKAFKVWQLSNRETLKTAREDIVRWGKPLSISILVAFKRERLVTKDGRLKKLDVSNRTKSLHDLLSAALGIDDCLFVSCPIQKVVADTYDEQVVACIRPSELRGLSDIDLQELR